MRGCGLRIRPAKRPGRPSGLVGMSDLCILLRKDHGADAASAPERAYAVLLQGGGIKGSGRQRCTTPRSIIPCVWNYGKVLWLPPC